MYFKTYLSEIATLEIQSVRILTRYCKIIVKELILQL